MAYLKLVRWPNLLIIVLILVLIKTQLIDPFWENTLLESCVTELHWWLLGIATVFIAASGNVVNDIFDQDIDRYNKPDRLIVGKIISEEKAWNFYYGLGSVGLGSGIVLCYLMGNISNALIFMLTAGGLYFYSYSYKRQFLIGNVVIALLAGLVPVMPLYLYAICDPDNWLQSPWSPMLIAFAFFSALTTLIREMIKDLEDLEGDKAAGCQTVPAVIGTMPTKIVVVGLIALLMAAVGKMQAAWWAEDDIVLFWYFFFAVQVPSLVLGFFVVSAKDSKGFNRASNLTKAIMLGGVLSMLFFRTLLS